MTLEQKQMIERVLEIKNPPLMDENSLEIMGVWDYYNLFKNDPDFLAGCREEHISYGYGDHIRKED